MRRRGGAKTFLAIEIKYAENMAETPARERARYDECSRSSGLFLDPDAPALRRAPLQQFWREHLLAQTLIDTGLYDAGAFILIAPKLNADVQRAAATYQTHLAPTAANDTRKAGFLNVTLEQAIDALRHAGAAEQAQALYDRYLDFGEVHALA